MVLVLPKLAQWVGFAKIGLSSNASLAGAMQCIDLKCKTRPLQFRAGLHRGNTFKKGNLSFSFGGFQLFPLVSFALNLSSEGLDESGDSLVS